MDAERMHQETGQVHYPQGPHHQIWSCLALHGKEKRGKGDTRHKTQDKERDVTRKK
jgi:hypothetical protein